MRRPWPRRCGHASCGADYALTHYFEGLALLHLERTDEARVALERSLELALPSGIPSHSEIRAALALGYTAEGNRSAARELLEMIDGAADPFAAALVHAALGEVDRAIALLSSVGHWEPKAIPQVRFFFPEVLGPLRERAEFERILRKVDQSIGLHEETPSGAAGISSRSERESSGSVPSIAVLPFSTSSSDAADEHLSDGIADELINTLGRQPDLRVAARTSAFSFKGTTQEVKVVGQELGVGTVLEGTVRRSGDRLRITAQLADVESGFQLWSERYERRMADVFDIQDEIVASIAGRLKATLIDGPQDQTRRHGTQDIQAFELCARGRTLLAQRTRDEMRRAVASFQAAVDRDPLYAVGWAGLGGALILLADYGFEEFQNLHEQTQEALDRALELGPDLPEAHLVSGLIHYRDRRSSEAVESWQRAIELRPSYGEPHDLLSWVYLILGHADSALAASRRAVELDPLAPEALNNFGLGLLAAGGARGALREFRRSRDIQPDFTTNRFYEAVGRMHLGELAEAAELLEGLSVPWTAWGPKATRALADAALGRLEPARERLTMLEEAGEYDHAGLVRAVLGDLDGAFDSFGRVESWSHWPMLVFHNYFPELLAPMRADPRYEEVLQDIAAGWGASQVKTHVELLRGKGTSVGGAAAPQEIRAAGPRPGSPPASPSHSETAAPRHSDARSAPIQEASAPGASRTWMAAAMLAVALGVVVLALVLYRWNDASQRAQAADDPAPIRSVVVLPFENLMNDPAENYFVEGMHDALITQLSKTSSLDIISQRTAMHYAGSDKPLRQIAQELNVDAAVEGSVLKAGDVVPGDDDLDRCPHRSPYLGRQLRSRADRHPGLVQRFDAADKRSGAGNPHAGRRCRPGVARADRPGGLRALPQGQVSLRELESARNAAGRRVSTTGYRKSAGLCRPLFVSRHVPRGQRLLRVRATR